MKTINNSILFNKKNLKNIMLRFGVLNVMTTYFYHTDLLKYLGLNPDFKYTKKSINDKINKKKLVGSELKKIFPEFQVCGCGKCPVQVKDLQKYIDTHLIMDIRTPNCNFYEFNQKPNEISAFVLQDN